MDETLEGIGEETDDWMEEDDRKEFINFKERPGEFCCVFVGKPTKQTSKFGQKTQYWFPVKVLKNMDPVVWQDMIMSTSSKKLRAKLTEKVHKYGEDKVLGGKMVFNISWDGQNLDRYYSVGPISDGSADLLLEKL